ncbi:YebC/PmpR family DNA-binding transcriptional regulator [Candidatus Cytomitobacter primus]|uniref:Probable transcriptional regulatory protein FZC34_02230 n=1 Tax=Candidatus Cytomitobacter primus TaxID=2066024 RepID=A0A5C0UGN2_9PROT|nr:YebC/PmpR family DNA-binding transcriptional regulator [Candidatus Cytomitobacter primus]QEK38713.1 YebC/PmpR family DNA-binding transcriptional regulator [Candidatus Cytomitobacter primus]
MAGHSKFKNIMHRKNAQDAKRAKVFTKIGKILTIAARSGIDPKMNPSLRSALDTAKRANMPNENIQRAINKAADKNSDIEVRYTGYGPENTAFLIEAITDNTNRTVTELRMLFNKHGNGLTELSFMFDHVMIANIENTDADTVLETLIDYDIKDIYEDDGINVIADFSQMSEIQKALDAKFEKVICEAIYKPTNMINVNDIDKLSKFIDILEDHDDVQNAWHNCESI